jgi:hypothetical protein
MTIVKRTDRGRDLLPEGSTAVKVARYLPDLSARRPIRPENVTRVAPAASFRLSACPALTNLVQRCRRGTGP